MTVWQFSCQIITNNRNMSLPSSYSPNYFSIEDILVTQERIPCKFLQDVPNLGKLDSSAETKDLTAGTELEVPLWLVQSISGGRQPIVAPSLPKIYKEAYREILFADASCIDLHKLNLHFYELGAYVKKFDAREEVHNCLEQTFQKRFRLIMDLCEQTFLDPHALEKLDLLERRLYQDGHASRMKLNSWLMESNSRFEASEMVQNHKKRKRIDMESINLTLHK